MAMFENKTQKISPPDYENREISERPSSEDIGITRQLAQTDINESAHWDFRVPGLFRTRFKWKKKSSHTVGTTNG